MEIEPIHVQLTCLFCDAVLTGDVNVKPQSGDLISCPACGNENDYDSVFEVAKQKGISEMQGKLKKKVEEELKKLFK